MGSKVAPPLTTASMNKLPAITSVSLFASNIRLPAFAAAIAGCSPAAPTIAAMTISTSSCEDISQSAASPCKTTVVDPMLSSCALNIAAADSCSMTA